MKQKKKKIEMMEDLEIDDNSESKLISDESPEIMEKMVDEENSKNKNFRQCAIYILKIVIVASLFIFMILFLTFQSIVFSPYLTR